MSATPSVETSIAGVRAHVARARSRSHRVALVPTLGSLHDGHLAHVERARELADIIIVSIFVNPLQFGPAEDFERYPRHLDRDLEALAQHGVDVVFAPATDDMYPGGSTETRVSAGPTGAVFEGRSRTGHYDGVLTVVAKLINIVTPDVVTFGEKDAQQLFLVQQMVRDLNMSTSVEMIPTVRAEDGLALSSRNVYLDDRQRRAARAIPRSLEAAQSAGDRGIDAVLAAAQSVLSGEPDIALDYFAVVDPATFRPVPDDYRGTARALIAARVGETRLVDTEVLVLG